MQNGFVTDVLLHATSCLLQEHSSPKHIISPTLPEAKHTHTHSHKSQDFVIIILNLKETLQLILQLYRREEHMISKMSLSDDSLICFALT